MTTIEQLDERFRRYMTAIPLEGPCRARYPKLRVDTWTCCPRHKRLLAESVALDRLALQFPAPTIDASPLSVSWWAYQGKDDTVAWLRARWEVRKAACLRRKARRRRHHLRRCHGRTPAQRRRKRGWA